MCLYIDSRQLEWLRHIMPPMCHEERNAHAHYFVFCVRTCSGVMKAVDGKLRPESLLEEVGKRA